MSEHEAADGGGGVMETGAPIWLVLDGSGEGAPTTEAAFDAEDLATAEETAAAAGRKAAGVAFAAGEDDDRLVLIAERARTDPAYAALADYVLRGRTE
jgi:hypothetical protein